MHSLVYSAGTQLLRKVQVMSHGDCLVTQNQYTRCRCIQIHEPPIVSTYPQCGQEGGKSQGNSLMLPHLCPAYLAPSDYQGQCVSVHMPLVWYNCHAKFLDMPLCVGCLFKCASLDQYTLVKDSKTHGQIDDVAWAIQISILYCSYREIHWLIKKPVQFVN